MLWFVEACVFIAVFKGEIYLIKLKGKTKQRTGKINLNSIESDIYNSECDSDLTRPITIN